MSAGQWPVEFDPVFGCWLWTSRLDKDGYGIEWRGNRPSYAHRLVYVQQRGEVPAGKKLDHLCRRRRCVNPDHLEPVSDEVNQQRKQWRVRVKRGVCPKGHDMSVGAIVTPEGGRLCRTCARASQ